MQFPKTRQKFQFGFDFQELPAHTRQVNGVKFSPDAKRVVSCGSDFYMKVIDLKTGSILFSKGKQRFTFKQKSSQ